MPDWKEEIALQLRSLRLSPAREAEIVEELAQHLEDRYQESVNAGATEDEARRAALEELREGNLLVHGLRRVEQEAPQEPIPPGGGGTSDLLASIWQDIRYGLRMLRKNPGFTAVAVIVLALGIGATTAIFSVVEAVLLHQPPYHTPSQLVEIVEKEPQGEEDTASVGDFADWQEQSRVFQGLAAYQQWQFHTLNGFGEPDEVWASPVSANLFHLLGVNAVLGRTFAAGESQAVLLSFQYWRSHFASDPKLVGKTVTLDGQPYTVVGIAPADFEFPAPNTQMWIPLIFSAAERNDHEHHLLGVVARLKSGVTLQKAQAEMDVAARRLEMQYPKTNTGWSARVKQFKGPEISPILRAAVLALLGAVVFVQMIVCANVASLLLARSAAKQTEMAIRAALGAGRGRLIRQLVVESVLLAGMASVTGLAVASVGLNLIVSLVPKYNLIETQGVHRIAINIQILGFTGALSLLTGILVGLLPALRVSRFDLNQSLKEAGRTSGTNRKTSRLQRVLVVSEVALSLVLLVGAGLMVQTFERLERAPTGFNPDRLLTVRVPLEKFKYGQGPNSANFYREVLQRIDALPGVTAAGMANNLPFTGFHTSGVVDLPPNSPGGPGGTMAFALRGVSPGYFRAMQIPLREGRDFTPADSASDARCVWIINEAMARRFWPGEEPVGKEVHGACAKKAAALIVGVVGDSKQDSVDSQANPEVYYPYAQHPFASFLVTFVVRTSSNSAGLAAAVRNAVWEVDRNQPVIQMRTMHDVITESIWRQHFSASMLGIFSVIALLLAAVGIYGVLSRSVSQRTHEIGIRSALGATQGDILRQVVGEGLLLAVMGVAIGVAAAWGLTRMLSSLLYGVRPRDFLTFAAASLLLTGVALLAVYIPARRASKVDPMVALRCE